MEKIKELIATLTLRVRKQVRFEIEKRDSLADRMGEFVYDTKKELINEIETIIEDLQEENRQQALHILELTSISNAKMIPQENIDKLL